MTDWQEKAEKLWQGTPPEMDGAMRKLFEEVPNLIYGLTQEETGEWMIGPYRLVEMDPDMIVGRNDYVTGARNMDPGWWRIQSKIQYVRVGDYFIPDFEMEDEDREIGRYARLRRGYLEENYPARYSGMRMRDELNSHLAEVEKQCQDRMDSLMELLLEQHPTPDKETDNLKWGMHIQRLHDEAERIVMEEIIYN